MNTESAIQTPSEQSQNQQRDLSEMANLVHVSENGVTAHRPDGKFVSNYELEQIKAHEGQIESGLKGRVSDLVKMDTVNRAHRPNGQIMSKDEIRQIADHQEQIRDGLAGRYLSNSNPTETGQSESSDATEIATQTAEQDAFTPIVEVVENGDGTIEPVVFVEQVQAQQVEVDTDPKTLSERVNRIFTKAGLKLQELAAKAKEYYSDEDKGKERKAVSVAVGALALVAVAGATYYLSKQGHDTSALHNMNLGDKPVDQIDTSVHAIPNIPRVEAIQPEVSVVPETSPVNLVLDSRGDTVWDTVKEYAANNGVKLNNTQIQDEVSKILADNNQTWESARSMPVGTSLSLSPERIEEILKLKS